LAEGADDYVPYNVRTEACFRHEALAVSQAASTREQQHSRGFHLRERAHRRSPYFQQLCGPLENLVERIEAIFDAADHRDQLAGRMVASETFDALAQLYGNAYNAYLKEREDMKTLGGRISPHTVEHLRTMRVVMALFELKINEDIDPNGAGERRYQKEGGPHAT
jgi:hypothetical protein